MGVAQRPNNGEKLKAEQNRSYPHICGKCGATRTDLQVGSERVPDCLGWARGENCAERYWATGCHVCRMVLVFRGVRRVLRDDGTCWLNYGDSYNSNSHFNHGKGGKMPTAGLTPEEGRGRQSPTLKTGGLKSGDLVGVPWRVALALQADGWILRQDIIWYKPSPMPESVTNRCTKAHEYVFLLAKKTGYFYDAEAIKTAAAEPAEQTISNKSGSFGQAIALGRTPSGNGKPGSHDRTGNLVNRRSVWTISSPGYAGAHFATFPKKLIEPMILAGTSEYGCCGDCGAPWKRVTETTKLLRERPNEYVKRTGAAGTGNSCANTVAGVRSETMGWEPTCTCRGRFLVEKQVVRGQAISSALTGGAYAPLDPAAHSNARGGIPNGWAVGVGSHTAANYATPENAQDKAGQWVKAGEAADKERIVTVRRYVSDLPLADHLVVPCTVLDPFVGSGTTTVVAVEHGRRCWGIDLGEEYLRNNAVPRIEGVLLGSPELRHLAPRSEVVLGEAVRGVATADEE